MSVDPAEADAELDGDGVDGKVQALAAGEAPGGGVGQAGADADPGGGGGEDGEDYPDPSDFSGHELAQRINTFGDGLDPEGSAASTCRVGESYCATLDHYADAPGKLNLHPGWWALISTLGAGALIVYRRVQEEREKQQTAEARAFGTQGNAELAQPGQQAPAQGMAPDAPVPELPEEA